MSRKLTRREITQKDEFVSTVERGALWIESRWKTLLLVLGGTVSVVLLVGFGSMWIDSRSADADRLLGTALSTLQSPLLDESQLVSASGETGYVTAQERDAAALTDLDAVLESHPKSNAATVAAYMRGATLLRLDRPDDARDALLAFTQEYSGSALVPLARRALSRAEMAGGRADAALQILQDLVTTPSPMFPVDAALMELASAQEEAGHPADAMETFRRVTNEFPGSLYSGEAAQAMVRLTTLLGT